PQIINFLVVLDACEDHLRARHLGTRIFDVFLERCLAPCDARTLVGIAVRVPVDRSGLPAIQPVQLGPDLVRCAVSYRVARRTFAERRFTGSDILCERRRPGDAKVQRGKYETSHGWFSLWRAFHRSSSSSRAIARWSARVINPASANAIEAKSAPNIIFL